MNCLKKAIIVWMARRLPPCDVITDRLSGSLDRKLTLRERVTLRLHLKICVWCTRYGRQIAFIKSAVHEHASTAEHADTPTEHLSVAARDRIQRTLESDHQ